MTVQITFGSRTRCWKPIVGCDIYLTAVCDTCKFVVQIVEAWTGQASSGERLDVGRATGSIGTVSDRRPSPGPVTSASSTQIIALIPTGPFERGSGGLEFNGVIRRRR